MAIKREMLDSISGMIQPVMKQLTEVQKTAESALEMAIADRGKIDKLRNAQQENAERLVSLEVFLLENNLKFRGIPEHKENNCDSDLATFVTGWRKHSLRLNDGTPVVIMKAYRRGKPNDPRFSGPRDVVAVFLDGRLQKRILLEMRWRDYVLYNDCKVQVLQDLPSTVLQKCRDLKSVTDKLRMADI